MIEKAKEQTDRALSAAVSAATTVAGTIGRALGSPLALPGLITGKSRKRAPAPPGSTPGIESMPNIDEQPVPGTIGIRCIDYCPDRLETIDVEDLVDFLKRPVPAWSSVRWINVDGLHPWVVNQLRETFLFHTLAAEDVLRVPQRPKLEEYEDHLFVVVRMLMLESERLRQEQVSIFIYDKVVLTFQEWKGDVWDPIRARMDKPGSRLRQQDASYLFYCMLDSVVDHCFPILEQYGDMLEQLEAEVIDNATPEFQRRIHRIKRELSVLRRVIWPLREVLNTLQREECVYVSDYSRTYMRDVYDHSIQVIDVVETYRETAGGLNDLYMSVVSNRMNEIMKVLTIMASVFIPITFIAGVYGMNFEYIPELSWKYSYEVFWIVCSTVVLGLLVFFYRRGWIGGGK